MIWFPYLYHTVRLWGCTKDVQPLVGVIWHQIQHHAQTFDEHHKKQTLLK